MISHSWIRSFYGLTQRLELVDTRRIDPLKTYPRLNKCIPVITFQSSATGTGTACSRFHFFWRKCRGVCVFDPSPSPTRATSRPKNVHNIRHSLARGRRSTEFWKKDGCCCKTMKNKSNVSALWLTRRSWTNSLHHFNSKTDEPSISVVLNLQGLTNIERSKIGTSLLRNENRFET